MFRSFFPGLDGSRRQKRGAITPAIWRHNLHRCHARNEFSFTYPMKDHASQAFRVSPREEPDFVHCSRHGHARGPRRFDRGGPPAPFATHTPAGVSSQTLTFGGLLRERAVFGRDKRAPLYQGRKGPGRKHPPGEQWGPNPTCILAFFGRESDAGARSSVT